MYIRLKDNTSKQIREYSADLRYFTVACNPDEALEFYKCLTSENVSEMVLYEMVLSPSGEPVEEIRGTFLHRRVTGYNYFEANQSAVYSFELIDPIELKLDEVTRSASTNMDDIDDVRMALTEVYEQLITLTGE